MITITILGISYLAALSIRIKNAKAPVLRLLTWNIHIILMALAIISLFLSLNGYGFKGAQTERIIFSLYAGTGLILYGLSKPEINARYYYLAGLFALPFVLAFGLIIPIVRTYVLMLALTLYADSEFQRYKIDDDYAIQTKTMGIMSRYPVYSMIEDKYGIFEKITPGILDPQAFPSAVRLTKKGADSVRIQLIKSGTMKTGGTNSIDTIMALKQGYLQ
ncbi:hypothetical protein CLV59_103463 [Chitinophaga dinghuensis]|uniref:Uncharacterized protein n=1 Tax=Chitinophaga dinghuensis TaxID=1539050 RepID=A0A327W5Q8_9BACT|nr:hypothetical protein [Chitinophaga dinghuensis]RAJ83495.1 hypothetical protein CLV59_103463 [Chitinophaga dinghuensis]